MAPPSFTATFKPSPDQAEPYPFLLTTEEGDGLPVNNLIQVEDGATEISIAITLAGDASFPTTGSPPPIVWTLAPDEHSPYVLSGNNNNILKFTVPAPSHVLHPWVFRFIVNISGVTGIRSQNIYIAKLLAAGPEIFLKYAADKGNFSLVEDLDSPQVGAILGEELVLVNVHPSRTMTVNLVSDPPPPFNTPVFASTPIIWSSGEQPDWITDFSPAESQLSFTIGPPAPTDPMGRSIGLQFAIAVTNTTTGDSMTILSPDPILINATIGDG